MRKAKTRREMAAVLRGGPGRLVMPDLIDNISFLNGRDRVQDPDLTEWIATCHGLGVDVNITRGESHYLPADHPLGRKRRLLSDDGGRRVTEIRQPTPLGPLTALTVEEPGQKPARTKMFLEEKKDYEAAIAFLRALRECGRDIVEHFTAMRKTIGDGGLLSVFVPQPMEMFFLVLHAGMVYHYIDWPDTYQRAMAEVERTGHFIIDCAADAGADMVVIGGAGTEIFNPEMIRDHIVAPSVEYIRHCERRGLFALMHCCGQTNIFLKNDWFQRLKPTIFESFSPRPLGDIDDPARAAHQLPAETFFKGGLSLDQLRRGSAEQAAEATARAYRDFGDRRFILAGTCGILTGTPRENILAVTETADRCYD